MNYYYNDIRHPKGDTKSIGLVLEDLEGQVQELDTALFTCRDNLNENDSVVLFQKKLWHGIEITEQDTDKIAYSVRIAPSDTKNLESGTYFYDLEIGINGDIFTVMKGRFILEQDCSRGEV